MVWVFAARQAVCFVSRIERGETCGDGLEGEREGRGRMERKRNGREKERGVEEGEGWG